MKRWGVYDKESNYLVLDADTEREAHRLRLLLYAQDAKDRCLEKGCYDVRPISSV